VKGRTDSVRLPGGLGQRSQVSWREVSYTAPSSARRDRGFESGFLQWGVYREPVRAGGCRRPAPPRRESPRCLGCSGSTSSSWASRGPLRGRGASPFADSQIAPLRDQVDSQAVGSALLGAGVGSSAAAPAPPMPRTERHVFPWLLLQLLGARVCSDLVFMSRQPGQQARAGKREIWRELG
jgi:hypothetical protein